MTITISEKTNISKIPANILNGLSKAQIEYIQSLQNQVHPLQKTQKEKPVVKVKIIKQPAVKKQKPIRKASIYLVGQDLGFKRKAFLEYLEQKKIDLSKFRNEL